MRDSNINNLNNHVENSDSQHDRSFFKKKTFKDCLYKIKQLQ